MVKREVHFNSFETGFYDQDGIGELTIPNGVEVYWRHDPEDGQLDRVEADAKDVELGHPEVFSGRYSASLAWTFSTGSAALVSGRILDGLVGQATQIKASYMHVFADGGEGGGRLGVVFQVNDPFDGTTPHAIPNTDGDPFTNPAIAWGHWVSTRDIGDREWVTLESPTFTAQPGYYRYLLQFNSDLMIPGSGHFDAVSVIQDFPDSPVDPPSDPPVDPPVDPPIPPASGSWTVTITDATGAVILQEPFQPVNSRIRALAQEIVDLS